MNAPPTRSIANTTFLSPPSEEGCPWHWPTLRTDLHTAPDRYTARTLWNPLYGLPGWTRDCGRRFHHGCDIAAWETRPTGQIIDVVMTDCRNGTDIPISVPGVFPVDSVAAVTEGRVSEVTTLPDQSILGRHVIIEHIWPISGRVFFTLYAHLDTITVMPGQWISAGQSIGTMGTTSASADARRWMAVAPHLHFEVFNEEGRPYDPYRLLVHFIPFSRR